MAEILLGVTGGVAAYKAVSLVSLLRKAGHSVNCILTEGGEEFITPMQLSSVSGQPCYTRMFPPEPGAMIPHIALTDHIDLLAVVPATAHFIGRAAHGLADDLLTSAFLACAAPVLLAPAMNTRMWTNQAVQANVRILTDRGIRFAGPVDGLLACGATGPGRMMEPLEIFRICSDILNSEGHL
jgi:phosphopantothenoylcysteine decarboxylase/phosphopantothenate--cysteine ligase